jgi:hypothetical protein
MTATLIFGGRQWNSNSLFAYERDHLSSKKTSSVMKSWSNLGLRRRNKFEQDRKASFSTESDPPLTGTKWQQHNSTLAFRKKSKTLDYRSKSSLSSQSSRLLLQQQANVKHRSGLTNHPSTHHTTTSTNILNNSINNNRYLSTQIQDSSSPWNINENSMEFSEFVELFKSFYFHCR